MKITKKHIISFAILSLLTVSQIIAILPLYSQPANAADATPATSDNSLFDNQTGMGAIGSVYGNNKMDVRLLAARIINIVLGFLAIIFLILILIAGYRYMMASGNSDATSAAISSIKHAIIGMMITLGSWGISRWVILRIKASVDNQIDVYYPN